MTFKSLINPATGGIYGCLEKKESFYFVIFYGFYGDFSQNSLFAFFVVPEEGCMKLQNKEEDDKVIFM